MPPWEKRRERGYEYGLSHIVMPNGSLVASYDTEFLMAALRALLGVTEYKGHQ